MGRASDSIAHFFWFIFRRNSFCGHPVYDVLDSARLQDSVKALLSKTPNIAIFTSDSGEDPGEGQLVP